MGRLWRHPDFLKLWGGQSVSELGSQVTYLALPTAAIVLLGAGPEQLGLLGAAQFLAFPVLGLFAGVWADRLPRRLIMVACDVVRLVALATIPAAYAAGLLTMAQLYVVALVMGVGTVFFDVAYQAYLPALVPAADLREGNAKLEIGRSSAQVVGPALAGLLIQVVRAAPAIAVDALSYAVSVVSLLLIRAPDVRGGAGAGGRPPHFLRELWEGVEVVFRQPVIRLIAGATSTSNLGSNIAQAVLLLFAYGRLGLSPGQVGLALGAGSVGALIGAFLAVPAARRLGTGRAIAGSMLFAGLGSFVVLGGLLGFALPLYALSSFCVNLGGSVYNINQVSLRQALVPVHLQGRLNATVRTVIWGTIPIGSVIGGLLGARIGLAPTILVGALVELLAVGWTIAGPVRRAEPPATAA
jgi:MFS family permease